MSQRREILAAVSARDGAALDGAERTSLDTIDPRVRICVAVLFAIVVVGIDRIGLLAGCIALALVFVIAAKLPLGRTAARLAALDLFIAFSVILLPLTMPGTELVRIGPLVASVEGSAAAILILMKATAVILAVVGLVGTLDAVALGQALAGLAVPPKLIALLFFTVRYIEVLDREQARLRLAMKARAFTLRTNLHTWRTMGYLVGMLLVRSFERAERVLAAMKCRGFTGTFPVHERLALDRRDLLFAAGCAVLLVAALAMDRL